MVLTVHLELMVQLVVLVVLVVLASLDFPEQLL
jgi:hypothetical protein